MPTILFALAVLVSAFLLFWVQPLFAKMILPRFGGASSVWTTVMLFFQVTLLLGYGYVYLSDRWLRRRSQVILHSLLLLLATLALPFSLGEGGMAAVDSPIVAVLLLATLAVGLPFFALSATAPLLQLWFSSGGRDPYFLYAASNLGSMAALLLFPVLLEPALAVVPQTILWQGGFSLLAVLLCGCALFALRTSRADAGPAPRLEREAPASSGATRCAWVFWAFLPSSAMLGLTSHVTTDIAPAAMFWVLPLALYLLSYVIVFSRVRALLPPAMLAWAVVLLAVAVLALRYWGGDRTMARTLISIPLNLLFFFAAACLLHGFLYRLRPGVGGLTEFYLWTACGGALGGIFNGIVAPLVFHQVLEYYLVMIVIFSIALRLALTRLVRGPGEEVPAAGRAAGLSALLLLLFLLVDRLLTGAVSAEGRTALALYSLMIVVIAAMIAVRRGGTTRRVAVAVLALVVGGNAVVHSSEQSTLHLARSFYGALRVKEKRDMHGVPFHLFLHGSTRHNMQRFGDDPALNREPLMYFHRQGNIGQAVAAMRHHLGRPLRFAVAGLGAGAMSAHTEVGDEMVFYEIDPEVVAMASNPTLFAYVSEARGKIDIIQGDARLKLAEAPDHHFDLIALDAFCGDAVPVHLLTAEAIALYLSKLKEDGLVVFHLSNRYLDLPRVLQGARLPPGYSLYYASRHMVERPEGTSMLSGLFSHSQVVLLARDEAFPPEITAAERWRLLPADEEVRPWTDDYSNIFQLLRF